MKHPWFKGLLALAGLCTAVGLSQAPPTMDTKQVMKFKLHYTQAVLEGIATENFDLIQTNAQNLVRLSQAAGWEVRQTREYQQFTAEFRRQAERLVATAKQKNVDAATVAYFQLTVSCVNCHRYLRDARLARSFPDPRATQITSDMVAQVANLLYRRQPVGPMRDGIGAPKGDAALVEEDRHNG